MGCFRRRRDGTYKKDADVTTFSLQHLRDQLNLLPIESNYCTSGFIHYYLLFVLQCLLSCKIGGFGNRMTTTC